MVASWSLWSFCLLLIGLLVGTTKRDATGTRPAFTAVNVLALLFVLYFIFPAAGLMIGDAQFTWAVGYGGWAELTQTMVIATVGLTAFAAPVLVHRSLTRTYANAPSSKPGFVTTPSRSRSTNVPVVILLLLIAVGVGLKFYMILTTGGFESMLLRLSGNARETGQVSGLDAGDIGIRTLSGIADAAATWGLCAAMKNRTSLAPWALVWLGVLLLSYATVGKRLTLLLPLIAVLLSVHYFVRPLTARLFPLAVLGALAFGMLTLLFRVYAPAETAGIQIDLNQVPYARGSLLLFYLNSLEFSTVEMMTVVIQNGSQIVAQFGTTENAFLQMYVFPFLYTVPRALWAGKPDQVFDLSYSVSSAILGRRAEDSNVGYITTLVGNSYLLGGVFGVATIFAAFSLTCMWIDRLARRPQAGIATVTGLAIALVLVFHFFRMGTLAWTFLIGVVQQYGFLLGVGIILLTSAFRRAAGPVNGELEPTISPPRTRAFAPKVATSDATRASRPSAF